MVEERSSKSKGTGITIYLLMNESRAESACVIELITFTCIFYHFQSIDPDATRQKQSELPSVKPCSG